MPNYPKVAPGQGILPHMTAAFHNDTIRAIEALSIDKGQPSLKENQGVVVVDAFNTEETTIERFKAQKITDFAVNIETGPNQKPYYRILVKVAPLETEQDEWVILQEPLPPASTKRGAKAVVSGATWADVTIQQGNKVTVQDGQLVTAHEGRADLVIDGSSLGSGFSLIQMGNRSGGLVALPVCGNPIPGRSGTSPGSGECCLYRILNGSLDPLLDESGQIVRGTVYNLHEDTFGEEYLPVNTIQSGHLVNDKPAGTTTTSAPGPDYSSYNPCSGDCEWEWDSTGGWSKVGGSCEEVTTTTSEPTTTTTCACPETTTTGDGSTTSTTSSTTTTPEPVVCGCSPPRECGETDGERKFTACSGADVQPHPECGFDPDCDCATTTTLEPPCTCNWRCSPNGWVLEDTGCEQRICEQPSETCDDTNLCGTFEGSGSGPDGGSSSRLCNEEYCQHWWSGTEWVLLGTVNGIACNIPCDCSPPPESSTTPSPCTIHDSVPCASFTGTTRDPCADCYTTTTTVAPTTTSETTTTDTTTTTAEPTSTTDTTTTSEPSTTTTDDPTTTTTEEPGACCTEGVDGTYFCQMLTPTQCTTEGGTWMNESACSPSTICDEFNTTTTTTAAPTGACCYTSGEVVCGESYTQVDCEAQPGYISWHEGSDCDPYPC